MINITARPQTKYTLEKLTNLTKLTERFSKNMQSTRDLLDNFNRVISTIKASQVNLPDFLERLKSLEDIKRSAVINVDIIPTVRNRTYQGDVVSEP